MSTTARSSREIEGKGRTIRELLAGRKYSIDYYQREYKWQRKQVAELLEDLAAKFLESHEEGADRSAVAEYGHYFLGSIIISDKDGQKFIIDGHDLTVHDLKRGTKLSATVTTTTTSVTDRTTTVGTGTVWWVGGRTVIITLPNGENRTYKVEDSFKFNIGGNKTANISDLKQGMKISAEKIVEEPRTEIVSNTVVTGEAPRK